MTLLSESRQDTQTTCTCCDLKIKQCPRCGTQGVIIKRHEATVYCDDMNCSIEMDYGHWCGEQDGKQAIHFVIEGWNEMKTKKTTTTFKRPFDLLVMCKHWGRVMTDRTELAINMAYDCANADCDKRLLAGKEKIRERCAKIYLDNEKNPSEQIYYAILGANLAT